LTGSTLFSLSVTLDAQGLSFTETGNSVLPFTSGIMLGQTSAIYLAASTSSSQPGAYAVPKLAGGSLGSATPSNTNITGPTGIVVDNNGNPSTLGIAGDANFLSNGSYAGGGGFEDVPPNGGTSFTVSPTLGTGVNFINSTADTNDGVAAAQFKSSSGGATGDVSEISASNRSGLSYLSLSASCEARDSSDNR
jgi:hypothetical protein